MGLERSAVTVVLGFDPSLSHSAAHWAGDGWHCEVGLRTGSFAIKSEPKNFAHRVARLRNIRDQLCAYMTGLTDRVGPGVAFVEGYSFGARREQQSLGEWGGQLRLTMLDLGWDIVEVPPSTLKKYVTGKGTAEKDGMRMEVLKRWKYESTDNNDADAYALMRMGLDWVRWTNGEVVTKALAETLGKLVVMRHDATVELPQSKRRRKVA